MKIESSLAELINSDHTLAGIVNGAVANFKPWIENSQMPLFPEYTDHSLQHVEEVLQTAIELATGEARDTISAVDASILTLAVCLHDCAMHLTEDGFATLISPNCSWPGVPEFDSQSWLVLWEDFLAEARRFDGRKLLALFGNTDPVRTPPRNTVDLTKRDRLLMGEFVRRHHARLAHEIAIRGIPGVDGKAISLVDKGTDLSYWLSDMSGVVARSHGIPLRSALDYLRRKYDVRNFNRAHSVYLMALLRIADYLQIQAKRAPSEVLKVRKLSSPVSQGEWKVHEAVRNITAAVDDPEAR